MKLKELKRTVNVCWSPAEHHPVSLLAGSAAQQVDASFSSNSYLELYTLNLEDPGTDLELKSSIQTKHKFQKVVWSGAGNSSIIIGGCDGGLIEFYNAEKLQDGDTQALVGSMSKHTGHVSALDINPYQKNLFASGASESEIFIWDLNNTSQPMAPGNKSQPYDHVQGVAWNQQVQHILGSTFASRCVVWDLRKNEPIMKLSDSLSRTRWRSLAWHPSVATQVCITSEDDQVPVVQLWDLRLAASPLATLEGHQKGVLSLSWSRHDPDLLLTAGKDGRVLCWNPNNTQNGESLLCEISEQQQWVFDVSWCERSPALFAAASFDNVNVFSVLGGSKPDTNTSQQSNIMESFGAQSFSQLPAVARSAPAPRHPQLPRAPAWFKRSCRAKFAFGGKLVTFDKCPEADSQKQVYISQVVSEPEIVEKAAELDAILNSTLSNEPDAVERLAEYCRLRGDAATDQQERYTWFFLKANFSNDFRSEALNLLGFKQDDIPSKFKSSNAGDAQTQPEPIGLSRGESTETEAELSTDLSTSTDLSDANTLIERKLANLDLETEVTNVVIPNGEDSTSLICRALVCGNYEEAAELCLDANKIADALIIASLGGPALTQKVQQWYLHRTLSSPVSLVTAALSDQQWSRLVTATAASSGWKHVLAALLTHAHDPALPQFAEMLGDKLSAESEPSLSAAATICYLVAMSPDALVARWARSRGADVDSLAHLTALALITRRAATNRGRQVQAGGSLESVLCVYAGRLAAQGCLHSARGTLAAVQTADLSDRLTHALGLAPQQQQQQPAQRAQPPQPLQPQYRAGTRRAAREPDPYAPPAAASYEQQWQSNTVQSQQFSRYHPQAPQLQPQPVQPLQPLPTPPPPTQPARPGSVGPQSGGISTRSKYKLDPSVQSAPLYNQYNFNNPVTSQPQSYGYNSPVPDQYQNSIPNSSFAPINSYPGTNTLMNPMNPGNPSLNPMNPGLNPGNPNMNVMNPLNPVNPSLNPLNPSLNPVNPNLNQNMNPAVNGSYYQSEAPAPSKPVAPGWNDPPMLSSKARPKAEVQQQAPITHPLFGVEPQHVPLNPANNYPQQYQQQQQYPAQQYQQQQYPGQYEQQYAPTMNAGYQQQPEVATVAEPPPPVQKPPLPEEHVHLQTLFDELRAQCNERAHNPQMKRKLEDVQRRLEMLYDLLREYKLSESALQTLNTCSQQVRAGDHASALTALTALATGTDFAAAASFLPGLKVLLQLAQMLQVYVS